MTDRGRWERIEAILEELLELPPARRRERLEALTEGDPEITPWIEQLLAADEDEGGGVLDQGIDRLAEALLDDASKPPKPAADGDD